MGVLAYEIEQYQANCSKSLNFWRVSFWWVREGWRCWIEGTEFAKTPKYKTVF